MMGLFGKLFHHPAVPEELRAQLEAEGLIYLAEKVGVTLKFSGSIPGLFSGDSRNRGNGTLAITRQRLYATFPSAPRLAGPAIDQQWDAQKGPAVVTLDESGVQLDIEIGRLDPRFHGQLTLLYRQPLAGDVLRKLPARSLRFTVPPEYVFHILGVRAKS
jgi:hypothetical protein